MKTFFLSLLVSIVTSTAFATKLLSCNPPMGSSLQEVKISQEGTKIYRSELNFSGSYSIPVEINATSWAKKDLKFRSKADGNVHLYQVVEQGQIYWMYVATNLGSSVNGYCDAGF